MQDTVALGAYTEAILSAPSDQRPLEWWERWRVLLPIMILLCLIGQFIAPMLPDVYPVLVVSLIATLASLGYAYWRVSKILPWSKEPQIEYTQDGPKVVRRPRRTIYSFALSPVNLLLYSTLTMIFRSIDVSQYTSLAFNLCALLASILFVFLWPSNMAKLERFNRNNLLFAVLLVGQAVAFIIIYASVFYGIPRLLAGPPASWPNLVAFAQREADKVTNDARLMLVRSSKNFYVATPSDANFPMKVSFYFSTSDQPIEVNVVDTNPPRLISVHDTSLIGPAETSEVLNITRRIASIALGPRDLYLQTESEARQFAIDHHSDPSDLIVNASLYLSQDYQAKRGAETIWTIDYIYRTPTGLLSLDFTADASTGKIIDRGEN